MRTILSILAATSLLTPPAAAQRTDDNAITDAEDAFGSNDGGEDLGLYGPFDVRGFSPIDAGNVRIDGIFVDRQGDLNPRLIEGSRIRVGPSATSYAFPAPSGIVDYRLRTPGDETRVSGVIQGNSFGGALVELDAAFPVSSSLSFGGGVSQSHSEYASGNNADISHLAALARWRTGSGDEATLFWSRTRIVDEDIFPIVLGDGTSTPPRIERRRFLGQPWADVETERFNYGVVARTDIGGFKARAGVFRSTNETFEGHSVVLQAAAPGELASRTVSAYPGRRAASTSGELGFARAYSTGPVEQRAQIVLRGRSQGRRYGGTQRLTIAPAPFGASRYVTPPPFQFSPQTLDSVRQWSLGFAYQADLAGVGRISAGIQKAVYRKKVVAAGELMPKSRDQPWLPNVAASLDLSSQISLFASFTRGLEESDVAPEIAVNRDEAPPAIRTRQLDAGLKFKLGWLTAIAGAFEIQRPYYGVDPAGIFRRLGSVQHQGVEASLTGTPVSGLTLVAGGTFLHARLSGEEVASGAIGKRPVDVPRRKAIASFDWRPSGSPISFDVAIEHIGPNTADAANRVQAGAFTTVDIGVRHRFALGDAAAVLRVQATNIFNSYGWEVAGNNAFIYTQSRQVVARLAVDF